MYKTTITLIASFGIVIVFFSTFFYGIGLPEGSRASFLGGTTLAVLVSLFAAHTLKKYYRVARISHKESFFKAEDVYRFPSEHAAMLASLSTYVAFYDVSFAYTIATLTAITLIARVLAHVHTLIDIIVGIGVGVVIAVVITIL